LIDDSIASDRSSTAFDAGVAMGQALVADRDPALDLSNVADGRPEADEHRHGAHQADPNDAGQPRQPAPAVAGWHAQVAAQDAAEAVCSAQ
jgi:hypothetical protein